MNMTLLEQLRFAKINKKAFMVKEYFPTSINWWDALNFIYQQTQEDNDELKEQKRDRHRDVDVFGNVLTQHPFWLAPQTGLVWNHFKEIKNFLIKINSDCGIDADFTDCNFYKHWDSRNCSCDALWHSEGIKVSLGDKFVPSHSDPWDAFYFQIIGKSFWRITDPTGSSEVYELDEGDILFFPIETSHEVWSEGPRTGLLVNADSQKDLAKYIGL